MAIFFGDVSAMFRQCFGNVSLKSWVREKDFRSVVVAGVAVVVTGLRSNMW